MALVMEVLENVVVEHFQIEPSLREIAVFSRDDEQELKLIEVNEDALPTGQVEPFVFTPEKEQPIPIYIADVTPDEWSKILKGKIALPQGWPSKAIKIIHREQQLIGNPLARAYLHQAKADFEKLNDIFATVQEKIDIAVEEDNLDKIEEAQNELQAVRGKYNEAQNNLINAKVEHKNAEKASKETLNEIGD